MDAAIFRKPVPGNVAVVRLRCSPPHLLIAIESGQGPDFHAGSKVVRIVQAFANSLCVDEAIAELDIV